MSGYIGSACVHSGRTGERLFELIRIGPWVKKL